MGNSSNLSGTNVAFYKAYNMASVQPIDFDPAWKNGTGYFDHATKVALPPGLVRCSQCPTTRRDILLVGTRFGTVVVFQRYTDPSSGIFVSNWPKAFPSTIREYLDAVSSLSARAIQRLVGSPDDTFNIGDMIEEVLTVGTSSEFSKEG